MALRIKKQNKASKQQHNVELRNCVYGKYYVEQMQYTCTKFFLFLSIVKILFSFCFLTDADPENNTMITAST